MHTRFCCHTGGPMLVHWYQIPAAWTLSFRKRLYCHFRRNFWESLRIDDRYQMIFIAFYTEHLFYQLPDAPQPSSVDHISCLRRTLPPLLPFWCMNPYDMPTRLVEIKGSRRRAPLDCYSWGPFPPPPFTVSSPYAPSSSFSSSCYHCYHRCHCNVAVYVNYPTITLLSQREVGIKLISN